MKILVLALFFVAIENDGGLTTSYVQELRAEIALADHLVLRTSPENGGATRSTNELSELRTIAKLLRRAATVVPLRFFHRIRYDRSVRIARLQTAELRNHCDARWLRFSRQEERLRIQNSRRITV